MKQFFLNLLSLVGWRQKNDMPISEYPIDLMESVQKIKGLDMLYVVDELIKIELLPMYTTVYFVRFQEVQKGEIVGYNIDVYENDGKTNFELKYHVLEIKDNSFIRLIYSVSSNYLDKTKERLLMKMIDKPN